MKITEQAKKRKPTVDKENFLQRDYLTPQNRAIFNAARNLMRLAWHGTVPFKTRRCRTINSMKIDIPNGKKGVIPEYRIADAKQNSKKT